MLAFFIFSQLKKVEMKPAIRQARSRKPKIVAPEECTRPEDLKIVRDCNGIPGLIYIPEFLSQKEHNSIMEILYGPQNHLWVHEEGRFGSQLSRRNQQFGWRYNYSIQDIDKSDFPLPDWTKPYYERIMTLGLLQRAPEQMIVNEYLPGQGITPHVDKTHCFGDVITGLNLESPIIIEFSPLSNRKSSIEVYVAPRSAYLMTGEARFSYLHSIRCRTTDTVHGRVYSRKKRVSITLRHVILGASRQENNK